MKKRLSTALPRVPVRLRRLVNIRFYFSNIRFFRINVARIKGVLSQPFLFYIQPNDAVVH